MLSPTVGLKFWEQHLTMYCYYSPTQEYLDIPAPTAGNIQFCRYLNLPVRLIL